MTMRKKKTITAAGVVLVVGGMLAGCGTANNSANTSNTSNNSNSGSGTTNIVWAVGAITHTNLRKQLVAAFEKQYPNIHVTLQTEASNTDTTRQQLTTSIGSGAQTPDVYLGDVIWPAQFGHAGLAMSLNSLLPSSFFTRFSPGLVKGATYKGNVYGAPFFVDTAFLYYRKDLLKKAGLPVPTTWEQVMSESQTLQKDKLVKYGFIWQGASYEGLTCDFSEYLADAGGSFLNSSGQPSINTPQATKALTFMRSLVTSGVTPNAVTTDQENQSMNLFAQGDAAFLRNWSYAWSVSNDKTQSSVVGKVGVTVLPAFAGSNGHYSSVGGWNLYVNPHSQHLSADKELIDFLTGPVAQKILVQHGELPTNAAIAAQASTIAKTSGNNSPIFNLISKTDFISRPSQSPNYPQISQAIYQNANAVLAGSESVKAGLQKMQQQMQSVSSNSGL